MTAWLCRDCGTMDDGTAPLRCPSCAGPRLVAHAELRKLTLAHVDADCFFASVEKRDDPSLRDKPVIVGGGTRGVVAACCYVARRYGVRSAMPMFEARALCPAAVVLPPDLDRYREVGARVHELMLETTPLVERVSIDEAYLDLSGTELLHGGPPARTLARLASRVEREVGVTVSIGLSYNKFLAKIASDLDKPRGFAVLGQAEALAFLAEKPVTIFPGVGPALAKRLHSDGLVTVADLQHLPPRAFARYGAIGGRLLLFSRGADDRKVDPEGEAKTVGAETTFARDLSTLDDLSRELWPLCERVVERLKSGDASAAGIVLKLKTSDFQLRTRSKRLETPTRLAETLFRTASTLLEREADGTRYRLIGVTADPLAAAAAADPPDLFQTTSGRDARIERAMDAIRGKLGEGAIMKGRSLPPGRPRPKA